MIINYLLSTYYILLDVTNGAIIGAFLTRISLVKTTLLGFSTFCAASVSTQYGCGCGICTRFGQLILGKDLMVSVIKPKVEVKLKKMKYLE